MSTSGLHSKLWSSWFGFGESHFKVSLIFATSGLELLEGSPKQRRCTWLEIVRQWFSIWILLWMTDFYLLKVSGENWWFYRLLLLMFRRKWLTDGQHHKFFFIWSSCPCDWLGFFLFYVDRVLVEYRYTSEFRVLVAVFESICFVFVSNRSELRRAGVVFNDGFGSWRCRCPSGRNLLHLSAACLQQCSFEPIVLQFNVI